MNQKQLVTDSSMITTLSPPPRDLSIILQIPRKLSYNPHIFTICRYRSTAVMSGCRPDVDRMSISCRPALKSLGTLLTDSHITVHRKLIELSSFMNHSFNDLTTENTHRALLNRSYRRNQKQNYQRDLYRSSKAVLQILRQLELLVAVQSY